MPLSHHKIALVYRQLGQQLGAGLTLAQALSARSPIPSDERKRLVGLIAQGQNTADIFTNAGNWLPQADRPVLIAAAATGRLPLLLQSLSDRHAQLASAQTRLLLACAYPAFVLHFGALVFAFFRLMNWEHGLQWDAVRFFSGILWILGPVWAAAILLYAGVRKKSPLAIALLDLLPVVGSYRRNQALANFSFVLGQLLSAGARIDSAWHHAGSASGSKRIAKAAAVAMQLISNGEFPGPHLAEQAVFPDDFTAAYLTGEQTGDLDNTLIRQADLFQGRANSRLTAISILYPALLFFAVAALIAWIVISFYAGYLHSLLGMMQG